MIRARVLQGLALASWVASAPALAADEQGEALPEDAFLEFLGGFETADGDWVDPMSLAELDADGESSGDDGASRERDEDDES